MDTKSEKLTFWQKLGYGVGDFYGGGAGKLIEATQTPAFVSALRLFFVLIPVSFISFGIFFAARFPLTRAFYDHLETVLLAMRSNSKVDQDERQELIKRLVG